MRKGDWLAGVLLIVCAATWSWALTKLSGSMIEDNTITADHIYSADTDIWDFINVNISGSLSGAGIGGFDGALFNSEIQALTCAAGIGQCWAISKDEGDIYISTGSSLGGYRNSRTGKGP